MGYHKVYTWRFRVNLILSAMCWTFASPSHPYVIIMFLLTHTVRTGAVQSSGVSLAMSDMVFEMKRRYDVRWHRPIWTISLHHGEGRAPSS
jgi:hypothetical protein